MLKTAALGVVAMSQGRAESLESMLASQLDQEDEDGQGGSRSLLGKWHGKRKWHGKWWKNLLAPPPDCEEVCSADWNQETSNTLSCGIGNAASSEFFALDLTTLSPDEHATVTEEMCKGICHFLGTKCTHYDHGGVCFCGATPLIPNPSPTAKVWTRP